MTSIIIEQGVPFPEFDEKEYTHYPFNALQVGESFFLADKGRKNQIGCINSAIRSCIDRHSIDDPEGRTRVNKRGKIVPVRIPTLIFKVKKVDGGFRIWRTQ